jgi:hypothetical protein
MSGYEWGASWRRRGTCLVCGVYAVLTASCGRCGKWSCGAEGCVKVIKEVRLCSVPVASL